MAVIFPPLDTATPEGLLAVGGQLDVETLLTAYQQGIFPWPISNHSPLTWFSPDPRGIIEINDFHIPKSLQKFLKNSPFTIKTNTCFENVIRNCAVVSRKHEKGTWISEEIIEGYTNLFHAGHAYSIEVYLKDKLVGGLYGTCIGEIVSGESMFHTENNASKVALCYLVDRLQEKKIQLLDTQMVTPIVSNFGGKEVSREYFISLLKSLDPSKPLRDEIFPPN